MSKMGELLEKRLDENKYEMYEACRQLVDMFSTGEMDLFMGAINEVIPEIKKILTRIEGKDVS